MSTDDEQSRLPPVYEAWLPREHSLYRPRHGRKQTLALVCAAVFLATPVLSFVFGARPTEFENHALAPFPSPDQGWSFFSQLSQWATDHLNFREQAVHAGDAVSRNVFGEPPPLNHETQQQGPIQPPSAQTAPVVYPSVVEGKDGWLYLGDEISSHCQQAVPLNTTFAELDRLRDGVVASGRQFVVVVAPDKATIVPEYLPDGYLGKACREDLSNQFWSAVDGKSYILDLRSQLLASGAQRGAPIYGPQDAHWSDEGGVIMARSLAEKLRPGISSTWKVIQTAPWTVPADLPPLIGHSGQTTGTHYAILPDGVHNETGPNLTDYANPQVLATASGTGTYGLAVGLLGDSFTIRALPYLSASFANMTALHYSTADKDHGVAAGQALVSSNVVILEVTERSLVRGGISVLSSPALDNILKQLAG
jgi:alginate O-acetyltransferase complex protein AlgJ